MFSHDRSLLGALTHRRTTTVLYARCIDSVVLDAGFHTSRGDKTAYELPSASVDCERVGCGDAQITRRASVDFQIPPDGRLSEWHDARYQPACR
jgi:hypothetical protein